MLWDFGLVLLFVLAPQAAVVKGKTRRFRSFYNTESLALTLRFSAENIAFLNRLELLDTRF